MTKLNLKNIPSGVPATVGTIIIPQWGVAASGAAVSVSLVNNGGVVNGAVFLELACTGFNKPVHELKIMGHWGDLIGTMRAENDRVLTVRGANTLNYFHQTRSSYVYTDTDLHECSVTVSDGVSEVTVDFTCQMVADSVLLADTIYVNDEGLWADAPVGARYVTTPAAALAILNSNDSTHMAVLFRRARSWPNGLGGQIKTTSTARQVIFGAYGPGARPTVNCPGGEDGIQFGSTQGVNVTHVLRSTGIRWVGTWDPETETGGRGTGFEVGQDILADACIHDCDIVGFGNNVLYLAHSNGGPFADWPTNPAYYWSMTVSNTLLDLHQNYDILAPNQRWSAVLGVKCTTSPQARGGGIGLSGNGHGCRWSTGSPLGFHCLRLSDFYCTYNNKSGGEDRSQPAVRWLYNKRKDCKLTVDRCHFEASTGLNIAVGKNTDGPSDDSPLRVDAEVWACHFILHPQSNTQPINVGASGVWLKSNVIVIPDLQKVSGGLLAKAINLTTFTPSDQDAAEAPVVILNTTFVDHRTGANQNVGGAHGQYLGQNNVQFPLTIANDVYWYAEGASSPFWTDSGMDQLGTFVTTAPFNAKYESYQSSASPTPDYSFEIPDGIAMLVETGDVAAADLEVGQPFAPLDFFVQDTANKGAINIGSLAA